MTLPAASTSLALKTYDDLLAMPDDGNRYELIFGEIVMSPAPKAKHQYAVFELGKFLDRYARDHRLGMIYLAPFDVRISRHNVVQPDLFFVRREQLAIVGEDFVDGVPDMIVEVLSPSNRSQDLVKKAVLYADHGVPEYWIVDPVLNAISVNVLQEGSYQQLPIQDGMAQSTVLPGLKLRVADVFELPDWAGESADVSQ